MLAKGASLSFGLGHRAQHAQLAFILEHPEGNTLGQKRQQIASCGEDWRRQAGLGPSPAQPPNPQKSSGRKLQKMIPKKFPKLFCDFQQTESLGLAKLCHSFAFDAFRHGGPGQWPGARSEVSAKTPGATWHIETYSGSGSRSWRTTLPGQEKLRKSSACQRLREVCETLHWPSL